MEKYITGCKSDDRIGCLLRPLDHDKSKSENQPGKELKNQDKDNKNST